MPYLPGHPIILSRLPAKDWFTLDEAAAAAGWSRSFMRDRIKDGTLPAQSYQKPFQARAKGRGTHGTYRIHVDDLVLFIVRHGAKEYSEEKPFRDVAAIIRTWPRWMISELSKVIAKLI
jgi:hypothetical protein